MLLRSAEMEASRCLARSSMDNCVQTFIARKIGHPSISFSSFHAIFSLNIYLSRDFSISLCSYLSIYSNGSLNIYLSRDPLFISVGISAFLRYFYQYSSLNFYLHCDVNSSSILYTFLLPYFVIARPINKTASKEPMPSKGS